MGFTILGEISVCDHFLSNRRVGQVLCCWTVHAECVFVADIHLRGYELQDLLSP